MIAVIADDFTGAAELAGMGLRYQLQVEVNTLVNLNSRAELLVVATDTRSMNEEEAVAVMEKVTRDVMQLGPEIIYKKVDSVLRGHLLAELTAQMKLLQQKKVLLVPANPLLERTIANGTYFYQGRPIHESSFSDDPEFAIKSSKVMHMLRAEQAEIAVKKKEEPGSTAGITVGEASTEEDLKGWAGRMGDDKLAAGASGFFAAILESRYGKARATDQHNTPSLTSPVLFVCGTTFSNSRDNIAAIRANGGPVSYMPRAIVAAVYDEGNNEDFGRWADEITSFIRSYGKAVVAIDGSTTESIPVSAAMLREKTARVIEAVIGRVHLPELVMEGGSTAAAVFRRLKLNSFFPLQEITPGVIRMQVSAYNGLNITVKPGSYPWPREVWPFITHQS